MLPKCAIIAVDTQALPCHTWRSKMQLLIYHTWRQKNQFLIDIDSINRNLGKKLIFQDRQNLFHDAMDIAVPAIFIDPYDR